MLAHGPEILTEAGTAAWAMPAFTVSTLESSGQSVKPRLPGAPRRGWPDR